MKQLILTLGIILLLANIALGVIVNAFETFNLFFSCGVIVYTTIILLATCIVNMKDAFKVSLLLCIGSKLFKADQQAALFCVVAAKAKILANLNNHTWKICLDHILQCIGSRLI